MPKSTFKGTDISVDRMDDSYHHDHKSCLRETLYLRLWASFNHTEMLRIKLLAGEVAGPSPERNLGRCVAFGKTRN